MSTSTLFLNKLTVIDHALINREGIVQGGSYNLSVKVSGEVKGEEQVVVDFSKLKSSIKHLIDDNEKGYDHKLWFIRGYSDGDVKITSEGVNIKTPFCEMNIPENALKIFNTEFSWESLLQTIEIELENYLIYFLNYLYPNIDIKVNVSLDEDFYLPNHVYITEFRYIHGLKNSSSWGCQNIGHGHFSFISLRCNESNTQKDFDWDILLELENIFLEKNNVFIFNENIISSTPEFTHISYETKRGIFSASYDNSCYNIIVMNKETTIENIVEWFIEQYREKLSKLNVEEIYISEGLQKGSCRII